MPRRTADYDSPWKEALERYFRPFLALCFPHIERDIDWSRGVEFLDKELQRVVRGAWRSKGHVDKLIKVWRLSGEEQWVLVHVEVQSQPEQTFGERMYHYHSRLGDRYNTPVVSLAVLGDDQPGWRPSFYRDELWGCRWGMEFPVVKLLDFASQRGALESSPNPFAVIVLAHLDALETERKSEERSRRKLRLVKALYGRGLQRDEILELFRLVDWLVTLPAGMDDRFWQALDSFEESQNMPYVTSVERIGIRKGRQEGRQEGLKDGLVEAIRENLVDQFGPLTVNLVAELEQVNDLERLRALRRLSRDVPDLETFRAELGAP